MFHSDRGIQYAAEDFRKVLAKDGILQSMSRKGNCLYTAPMESFFRTMKAELNYPQKYYHTRQEAPKSTFEYIKSYYNRQRIHFALNYQTPEEFDANFSNSSEPSLHCL